MPFEFSIGELGYILAVGFVVVGSFQLGVSLIKPTVSAVTATTNNLLKKITFDRKKRKFMSLVGMEDMLYYPSYPSKNMQALLHYSYGFTPAETFILQRVIDWYLPIIEKKNDLKSLARELAALKGHSHPQDIHFGQVPVEEWSNLKQMLNLIVCALEYQYNDIAVIKERTLSQEDILYRKDRKESFSATSPQSPNDLIDHMETSSLSTEEELVLSEIEASDAQKHIWQKLREAYLTDIKPLSITGPTKNYQAFVVVELERPATLRFLEQVMAALSLCRDLNEGNLQQLIIGYTYENPAERFGMLAHLENYLNETAANYVFDAEKAFILPSVIFVDMAQPKKEIQSLLTSEIQKYHTEELLLLSYPEQHVFKSYLEKLNLGAELLSLIISRDCAEGFHPEHWLQTLRQLFRLKDSQHRRERRDSLEYSAELLLSEAKKNDAECSDSDKRLDIQPAPEAICYSQATSHVTNRVRHIPT